MSTYGQRRSRKALLLTREIEPIPTWYQKWFNNYDVSLEAVLRISNILAKSLGVDTSQLRPDDAFDHQLATFVDSNGLVDDEEMEHFESYLFEVVPEGQMLNYVKIHSIQIKTLIDLILAVNSYLSSNNP